MGKWLKGWLGWSREEGRLEVSSGGGRGKSNEKVGRKLVMKEGEEGGVRGLIFDP